MTAGLRGYSISPLRWVAAGWGYQRFQLPRGNGHVKVWHQPPEGERVCAKRVRTIKEARAYIRERLPSSRPVRARASLHHQHELDL